MFPCKCCWWKNVATEVFVKGGVVFFMSVGQPDFFHQKAPQPSEQFESGSKPLLVLVVYGWPLQKWPTNSGDVGCLFLKPTMVHWSNLYAWHCPGQLVSVWERMRSDLLVLWASKSTTGKPVDWDWDSLLGPLLEDPPKPRITVTTGMVACSHS